MGQDHRWRQPGPGCGPTAEKRVTLGLGAPDELAGDVDTR